MREMKDLYAEWTQEQQKNGRHTWDEKSWETPGEGGVALLEDLIFGVRSPCWAWRLMRGGIVAPAH